MADRKKDTLEQLFVTLFTEMHYGCLAVVGIIGDKLKDDGHPAAKWWDDDWNWFVLKATGTTRPFPLGFRKTGPKHDKHPGSGDLGTKLRAAFSHLNAMIQPPLEGYDDPESGVNLADLN